MCTLCDWLLRVSSTLTRVNQINAFDPQYVEILSELRALRYAYIFILDFKIAILITFHIFLKPISKIASSKIISTHCVVFDVPIYQNTETRRLISQSFSLQVLVHAFYYAQSIFEILC
jgi:hypothetical protein